MSSNPYAAQINNLSRATAKVHRSLLDFQKKVHEGLEERRLSPQETLSLAFNHPDFAWLRRISGIMAQMDAAADDKKNPASEEALTAFSDQLRELFIDGSRDLGFKARLDTALAQNPDLWLELGELRSALGKRP
jgi:hypothetical protein